MSLLRKPEVLEVYEFLRGRNAMIVHFSGTPKGAGSNFEYLYPQDLLHAIDGRARGGLSCSVVMPNDEFADLAKANATGCVGVILGFETKNSLVAAHPSDCGSRVENGVRVVPHERDLTVFDLEATIQDRMDGDYNEWVVRDYVVLGILAVWPFNISALSVPDCPPEFLEVHEEPEPALNITQTTTEELCETFSRLPIYTFHDRQIMQLTASGAMPVKHTEIYK